MDTREGEVARKRLYGCPMPLKGEVEWSWLVRIGHHFSLSKTEFARNILMLTGKDKVLPGLDFPLSTLQRQHVASLVIMPVFELESRFPNWDNRKYMNPKRSMRRSSAYCSACLCEEMPYFKFSWNEREMISCEKHGIRLFAGCWSCSQDLKPNPFLNRHHPNLLPMRYCPHCHTDLGKHPQISISASPAEIINFCKKNGNSPDSPHWVENLVWEGYRAREARKGKRG